MALRTRIEPIDRNIALAIRQGESPQERSAALAGYARRALSEAQEQNRQAIGSVPPHETFVDGRAGAALESVKPNGVIVFEFEMLADMFGYIDLLLIKHSPVKSGRYRRSHILLADGVEVDPSSPLLPDAEEYVYINTQPYARKIDKPRVQSPQAPSGVYEAVAALASMRFGNMARIRFGYRSLVGHSSVGSWADKTTLSGRDWQAGTRRRVNRMKGAKRRDFLARQPAIIITRG